jgi:D-alanyl-D-alanine dipeptidase
MTAQSIFSADHRRRPVLRQTPPFEQAHDQEGRLGVFCRCMRRFRLFSYASHQMKNIVLLAPLAGALLLVGCKSGPPKEQGQFKPPELIELVKLDSTIRLDVRYATTNNFMHRPMYKDPRAFLQRPAAEAIVRANQSLRTRGYGLLVFDGYRPWAVTKAFWDSATPEQRKVGFVADPQEGSKHNRGCAIDLTLFDLATGSEVKMPSEYDEFSERAFPAYRGGPPESRAMRDLLRQAMEAQGFSVLEQEWWHFDFKDWRQYRILDISFEALSQ